MRTLLIAVSLCTTLFAAPSVTLAQQADNMPWLMALQKGQTAQAEKLLTDRLLAADDDHTRYALGCTQILRAVETLAQSLHRYGLRTDSPEVPFMRLAIPPNENPEEIDYQKFRGIFQQFIDDATKAEQTLAGIESEDVKLELPIGLIRLDLNGDGAASEDETFWRIFTSVALRAAKIELTEEQKAFPIHFDRADVHWLRGYTHLLRALAETYLAHDSEEFFNATAHVFFSGYENTFVDSLKQNDGENNGWFDPNRLADMIAAIHLFSFEPTQPERMKKAHAHALAMIEQSRLCMEYAQQETDDDREWIPNAKQTSLMPNLEVTPERIVGWKEFLTHYESILQGETLVPHWRLREGMGINVKRVFLEPRKFDLVLWVHGAAAVPYLEEGQTTDQETWRRMQRTFGGNFMAFAIWFQ